MPINPTTSNSAAEHSRNASIVLFDFDGTLVSGDNGTRMILRIAAERWWPFVPMLLAAPLLLPLLSIPGSKNIGASGFLWLSTVGLSKKRLNSILERLASSIAHRAEQVKIEASWQRLLQHQRQGDRIVVVTGCWVKMAKKMLRSMGLSDITIIGSRKHRFFGGYISKPHCYARHKLTCLAERGIHPPFIITYTDSASDRHLLANSLQQVLVRPSLYTRTIIRHRYPDVEILS
ncbi:MAG: HAD family hydrolase [Gammaproteobacteria bacterium]|jgi:phosphatidylglycerophosphatase C|nr:HAD family hydrolase [Gammaproteobacteria bacterium]